MLNKICFAHPCACHASCSQPPRHSKGRTQKPAAGAETGAAGQAAAERESAPAQFPATGTLQQYSVLTRYQLQAGPCPNIRSAQHTLAMLEHLHPMTSIRNHVTGVSDTSPLFDTPSTLPTNPPTHPHPLTTQLGMKVSAIMQPQVAVAHLGP